MIVAVKDSLADFLVIKQWAAVIKVKIDRLIDIYVVSSIRAKCPDQSIQYANMQNAKLLPFVLLLHDFSMCEYSSD